MLEFGGAWGSHAVENNDLPLSVQNWLHHNVESLRARGFKTRPQLIRQQQLRQRDGLSLFVAFSEPSQSRLYQFVVPSHAEFAGIDLSCLVDDPAGFAHRLIKDELFFVCTNGQRDACCAIHGMRVYAEMSRHCESRVWQTTHLGGHRFAATLVSLPGGLVYGRLEPEDVPGLLREHGAGGLLLDRLRGRSGFDIPSQVAEISLRARTGHRQQDRYLLLEATGGDGIERRIFQDRVDGSRHELRLKPAAEPLYFQAGCGLAELKSRRLFKVLP
jgi:hypothetical protein